MPDYYRSYVIVPKGGVPGEVEYMVETGETVERPTQTRIMVDALDEDGNPTGEQRFDGWLIGGESGTEIETAPVLRGGIMYIGERTSVVAPEPEPEPEGEPEPVEPEIPDVAMVILSTEEALDQIVSLPDVVEVDRLFDEPEDDGPVPLAAPAPEGSEEENKEKRNKKSKLKAGQKLKVNNRLRRKGLEPVPAAVTESGPLIEHAFGQYKKNWRFGMDDMA